MQNAQDSPQKIQLTNSLIFPNIVWLVDQQISGTWSQLGPQRSTAAVELLSASSSGKTAESLEASLCCSSLCLECRSFDCDRHWKPSRNQVLLAKHQTSYLVAYCEALNGQRQPSTVQIPFLKMRALRHEGTSPTSVVVDEASEVQLQPDSSRSVLSESAWFGFLVTENEGTSLPDNGGTDSGKRCEGSPCVPGWNCALNIARLWP